MKFFRAIVFALFAAVSLALTGCSWQDWGSKQDARARKFVEVEEIK